MDRPNSDQSGWSAVDEEATRLFLASCLERQICPTCGGNLTQTNRYGTGSLRDGIYCSMACFVLPPS